MIYLDNASTTKISENALKKWNEVNEAFFYNPSSLHKGGIKVGIMLKEANEKCLQLLKGHGKFIWTSGATESNNLAILGGVKKHYKVLTSVSEHPSVLNVAKVLTNQVDYVSITKDGTVDLADFTEKMQTQKYDFISIMHVNNETGAINDIKSMVDIAKKINKNVIFHVDGTQAVGKIEVNFDNLGIDLYSFSSHKFHGPKGCGALFVKDGVNLKSILFGGGQQNAIRSGTENVPSIISMITALNEAIVSIKTNFDKVMAFRKYIIDNIDSQFDYSVNGNGLPHILSISFPFLKGEIFVHLMESDDILIGTGSACSSKKSDNGILRQMGLDAKHIEGNLRLSFSDSNTFEEIVETSKILNKNLSKIKGI